MGERVNCVPLTMETAYPTRTNIYLFSWSSTWCRHINSKFVRLNHFKAISYLNSGRILGLVNCCSWSTIMADSKSAGSRKDRMKLKRDQIQNTKRCNYLILFEQIDGSPVEDEYGAWFDHALRLKSTRYHTTTPRGTCWWHSYDCKIILLKRRAKN